MNQDEPTKFGDIYDGFKLKKPFGLNGLYESISALWGYVIMMLNLETSDTSWYGWSFSVKLYINKTDCDKINKYALHNEKWKYSTATILEHSKVVKLLHCFPPLYNILFQQ